MAGIHDTSSAEYHIKDLPAFLKRVEDATKAAFPNAGRSRYATVNVLLLFWEDDDLGVIDEVKVLERVFCKTYGYATERWSIPSQDADDALLEKLLAFRKNKDRDDNLFIIYYGGHGYLNPSRQPIWVCRQKLPTSTVKWYAHGAMLENLKSDVLILLDCCTAGGSGGDATNGVKEIIAACGFETWTPGVGSHSFTSALIEELKRLSTGPAFSIAALHSRILERLRHWSVVYNAEGYGYLDEQGRAQDRERNKTPVYIALNKDTIFRSIQLTPCLVELGLSSNSSETPSESVQDQSMELLASFMEEFSTERTDILISVRINSTQQLGVQQISSWIREIPLLATAVTLHGVTRGNSTMILMGIPVAIWDLLPDDPACSFVGFTTSKNLLLDETGQQLKGNVRIPAYSFRRTIEQTNEQSYLFFSEDTDLRFLEKLRGKESANSVQNLLKEDDQHVSWVCNLKMPSGRDSVNIRCIQRNVPQGMYKVCWHFSYIINPEDWDPRVPAVICCFAGKAVNEREFLARTTDFTQPWISTDFDKIIYPGNRVRENFSIPNVDHDKPFPGAPLKSGTYVRLMSSNAITVSDSDGRNIAILIRKLGPGAGGGLLFFMGCELLQLSRTF
ncbi:hypothetical protein MMC18_004813 [Xylographa bjoerkii]|nr:hypothetical protein [Xylographa bjoerkii]